MNIEQSASGRLEGRVLQYNVFSPKICKYVVFSPEIRKYGIFVAKICKNALIDSFEGFAVVIDNSASYAGLMYEEGVIDDQLTMRREEEHCCFKITFPKHMI